MNLRTSSFDAVANIYDETIPSHIANHYLEKRVRFIKTLLPSGARILDVGCGTGTLAWRLQGEAYKVVGVDGSEGMLRVALEKDVTVIRVLAQNLPFPDEVFDGVVSVALLHHLGSRDLVEHAISEIFRVTSKGGAAIIWDHNPLNPYWPILMRRVPQDDGSERLVSLREILGVVSALGGIRVSYYRLGFVPDFIPVQVLPLFQLFEKHLESYRLTRWLGAHNVVVIRKE